MTAEKGESLQFVAVDNLGLRLDIWLGEHLDVSRSQIKRLIDGGLICERRCSWRAVGAGRRRTWCSLKKLIDLKEPIPWKLSMKILNW